MIDREIERVVDLVDQAVNGIGRRGQRSGLPRHVSPPGQARDESGAAQGLHAVARRRSRISTRRGVSSRSSIWRCSSSRSRRAPAISTPSRPCA